MYRKRQSQSADRAANHLQNSGYKEDKLLVMADVSKEGEYIDDILRLLSRINRSQFNDAASLRHALKTQNSIYSSLLGIIVNVIDQSFEIKGFSDERFQLLLNRLGYPTKQISKTRFMSLGSAHTYIPSIHILSWLCRQAEQILNIHEMVENGGYMQVESASPIQQLQQAVELFLQQAYTGNLKTEETQLEGLFRDTRTRLLQELERCTKDVAKLTTEMNYLKLQDPNLPEIEKQVKQTEKDLKDITSETMELQMKLEQTRAEMSQLMRLQLELDGQVVEQEQRIAQKRAAVDAQPVKWDKAREIEQKDRQFTMQAQQLLQEIQKATFELDKTRQNKTQLLSALHHLVNSLNQDKVRVSRDFDYFESGVIPLSAQLQESELGVQAIFQSDDLLHDMDIEFEQKMMEGANDSKKRKSVMAYDLLVKRDAENIVKSVLLQNEEQIKCELSESLAKLEAKVDERKKELNKLKKETKQLEKQMQELECEKQMLTEQMLQLTDSTEEMKVMRQIFQEHQAKQQKILSELRNIRKDLKIAQEYQNLECLDIQRIQKRLTETIEQNQSLQSQAEAIEEQNIVRQRAYEQWAQEQLEGLLHRIDK